jgi:hypothetical protein
MKILKKPIYKIISSLLQSRKIRESVYQNYCDKLFSNSTSVHSDIKVLSFPEQYSLKANVNKLKPHNPPVFITARFRTGSTFLWSLFKNLEDVTSYYEPLHEKRFQADSLQVDSSHLGITDYDQEYQLVGDLSREFNPEWSYRNLYMGAAHYAPELRDYIDRLIENAKGRAVLQFNRVDFRLPWLKANYPGAKIVHLYRNPREQWMSILTKGGAIEKDAVYDFNKPVGSNDFYTLEWARDLRYHFPFLEPYGRHPYEIHYLLWRLSYLYGDNFSDISISYEELISNISAVFEKILKTLGFEKIPDRDQLESLNRGEKKNRWREYAPGSWFRKMESRCDRDIEIFFSSPEINERKTEKTAGAFS